MTSTKDRAAQIAAIKYLLEFDHGFISPEGVEEITKPFGFKGTTYEARDNRDEIKGLTLETGPDTTAEGQDADQLAKQICHKLGVSYAPYYGRGKQLRECCAAILKFLGEAA